MTKHCPAVADVTDPTTGRQVCCDRIEHVDAWHHGYIATSGQRITLQWRTVEVDPVRRRLPFDNDV